MKLKFLLSLSIAALMSVSVLAQAPAPAAGTTGKFHGHVTDPTGIPKTAGTVSLSTDGGHTTKYTFNVGPNGEFTGVDVAPGTYSLVLKLPDTPEGKFVDMIDGVKIVAGVDLLQDIDMSRKEYLDKMTPEQRKQVEEFRKKNAEVMKTNSMIKTLNADLQAARVANHDKKFDESEALMLKDTALKPDGELLWYELGMAQLGLKKWDDCSATMKKVLDLETTAKKPSMELQAGAHAALGEVYARTNKAPDAATEYDTAAKLNPTKSGFYYANETVVFQNVGNGEAQAAAADKAIAADPKNPIPFYLKGQALAAKITVDAKTGAYVLPPGMVEAYQTYLQLAPTGTYAAEVQAVLAETTKTTKSTYKAPKK